MPIDKKRLYTPREVFKNTTLSRSTINRMVKKEKFPAPIRISYRRIAWDADEVDHYIVNCPVTH
ncbi:helix-turn-helix transcriptional regulator [Rhizobium halophytocola]|uniref:Prophage regulatory protein n=1 Tax=Rhizobium halophytocola TaxID=735519 RepID=A0ABS4E471_9HYPH|nr:prophage regulatory protein [Rhizobium halophytocola]